jgi:hypothetical protein
MSNFYRGETLRADELNGEFAKVVQRTGDTMTGMLTLALNPSSPLDAVTKQYVDQFVAGSSVYLPIAGGTMLGPLNMSAEQHLGFTATGTDYLQYTTTGTPRLRYMVGATEQWSVSDNGGLSAPASQPPNVRFFGATLNGVAFDNAAYQAARTATGTNGSVVVPYGQQRLSVTPTGGPTTQILWRMDGTYIGAAGANPVLGIGTDVVENFFQGSKYFGRTSSLPGVAYVLRVDGTVNHTGGTAGAAISTMRINTNATSGAEVCIGASSIITDDRANGNANALAAYCVRTASRGSQGLSYGANIYVNDTTQQPTSVAGPACGAELDIIANGLDDGGLAGPFGVPAGAGVRTVMQAVGAQSTTHATDPLAPDCEIGWGIRVTPTSGSAYVVFKRQFAAMGRFNKAAFSTEFAVAEGGANAIWLATGHIIALDTAGTSGAAKVTLRSDGNNLVLGTLPTNAANDAAAASAGVPVGGVYRNGSIMMVRTA